MSQQPWTLVVVTLAFALVSACSSTPTATVDHDPGFDFGSAKSVAILPLNRNVTPSAAVSDLQANRIADSLGNASTKRGLEVTDDVSEADMLMTWHLVTQERTDIRTYNSGSAHYTRCWSCPTASSQNVRVRQYTMGTLIVDLLNPETNRSVWRSIFESRLRSGIGPEDAAELRENAANTLMAQFPPP